MICLSDNILIAYHNFEFDDATNKKIEAHLNACPACAERARFFESLQAEWVSPSVFPKAHLASNIMKKTCPRKVPHRKKQKIYLQFACALVAAILFLQFNVATNLINFTLNAVNYTNKAEQFIKSEKGSVTNYLREKRKENGGKNQ